MKKLLTLLFLFSLYCSSSSAQTANAGVDKTVYLTQGNSTTIGGASSGTSYAWTKINDVAPPQATFPTNNSTITSPTSATTTVTGLIQGSWNYRIAVTTGATTKYDTVVVRVDYDVPPIGGTYMRGIPWADKKFRDTTNARKDTSNQILNQGINTSEGIIQYDRGRDPDMLVDSTRSKFYSVVEDGYGWVGSGGSGSYTRSELNYGGNQWSLDSNKTYVFEWKGYIASPLNTMGINLTIASIMQIHSTSGTLAGYSYMWINGTDGLNKKEGMTGVKGLYFNDGTLPASPHNQFIALMDDMVNQTHTLRLTIREGKSYPGQDAFIRVEYDGVLKYLRTTGQVGATFQLDYPKIGTIYDYNNALVSASNKVRGRRFSLVTEMFNIFEISSSKITPTITWSNQSAVYGASLTPTHTATAGGVPGTYSYSISGTPNAGVYNNYTVTFTPTDQTAYYTVTKTVTLTITQATATLTFTVLSKPFNNSPQYPTVTTNPAGLPVTILLNGVTGGKTAVGDYSAQASNTNSNYTPGTITGTFTITAAPATISVQNTTFTYDSLLHIVTVVTSPTGLSYTISLAPQRYTGVYSGTVTLNETNYTATPVNFTLTITQGSIGAVTWNPANLVYPNPVGAGQTNATTLKASTKIYTPGNGTILSAGSQTLSLKVVPTDTNLAVINNITRTITVSKGSGTFAVSDTIQNYDGTVKVITVIPTPNVSYNVVYTGAHTAVGDYPFTVTGTDANYTFPVFSGTLHITSNAATIFISNYSNRPYTGSPISVTVTSPYSYSLTYNGSATVPTNVNASITVIATINDGIHTGADTVTMNIIKGNPATTYNNPLTRAYPYALQAGDLNASSPVAGSGTYNVSIGDTLPVGVNTIIWTFVPTDGANWNTVTKTATITITGSTATISVSNTSVTFDGNPHPVVVTTNPPNLDSLAIKYNGSLTPPTAAGSYALDIRLYNPNITATPYTGTLVIAKKPANLTWVTPAAIQSGSNLLGIALPVSDIAGTWTYSPSLSQVFTVVGNPVTYTLSATFTPSSSNYSGGTISVPIVVYGTPLLNFIITNIFYKNSY